MKMLFRSLIFIGVIQSVALFAELACFRAGIRHIEGKGIGYPDGYTTLDAFLMTACHTRGTFFPFFDLRGHGFDKLALAGNLGGGIRYLTDSPWIFGSNVYYDVRQGSHRNLDQVGHTYHQIGIGFEALGPCMDLRLNGYQPLGIKTKKFTQIFFNNKLGTAPIFSRKQQSTMKGADIEAGTFLGSWCFWRNLDWNLYAATGAYYLDPEIGRKRWGGKLRLKATIARYFTCEASGYYDKVDRGIAQISLGINFPLYPFASEKEKTLYYRDDLSNCFPTQREMIAQPVVRAEIIPLNSYTLR